MEEILVVILHTLVQFLVDQGLIDGSYNQALIGVAAVGALAGAALLHPIAYVLSSFLSTSKSVISYPGKVMRKRRLRKYHEAKKKKEFEDTIARLSKTVKRQDAQLTRLRRQVNTNLNRKEESVQLVDLDEDIDKF